MKSEYLKRHSNIKFAVTIRWALLSYQAPPGMNRGHVEQKEFYVVLRSLKVELCVKRSLFLLRRMEFGMNAYHSSKEIKARRPVSKPVCETTTSKYSKLTASRDAILSLKNTFLTRPLRMQNLIFQSRSQFPFINPLNFWKDYYRLSTCLKTFIAFTLI